MCSCSSRAKGMTLQNMFWPVLEELGDNMPVLSPGASECRPSSFTGENGGGSMRTVQLEGKILICGRCRMMGLSHMTITSIHLTVAVWQPQVLGYPLSLWPCSGRCSSRDTGAMCTSLRRYSLLVCTCKSRRYSLCAHASLEGTACVHKFQ